jgi:hypothetical protein
MAQVVIDGSLIDNIHEVQNSRIKGPRAWYFVEFKGDNKLLIIPKIEGIRVEGIEVIIDQPEGEDEINVP